MTDPRESRHHQTAAVLSLLDDHLLRDIGVVRSAIPYEARAARRTSVRRRIAALLLATMLLGGLFEAGSRPAEANSDIYCQGYAQEAVSRYRDYARKQCGERVNSVWNPGYEAHFAYCKRVGQATAEWVRNERHRILLNDCSKLLPLVAK